MMNIKLEKFSSPYLFISLLAVLAFLVFRDFLTFEKLFLFKDIGSDTVNISLPQWLHLADYLRTEGLPKWSFSQGLGQNIYPFSLGQPFEWILLLLGKDNLAYGIAYMECIKVVSGGLLFYLYLKEMRTTPYVAAVGGLLFAFSGYMILGGTWYQFSTDAVYGAFLLLALEKHIISGKWFYLPVAIALIAMFSPFNLFAYGLLILLYTVLRLYGRGVNSVRKMAVTLAGVIGASSLGLLLSAVFLFSNLLQYLQSPRVGGDSSLMGGLFSRGPFFIESARYYFTIVGRFFSDDLFGTGSQFMGWNNYLEAPMVYIGVISLLLLPQAFVFANKRQRRIFTLALGLTLIPLILPFFRYAFWLFTGDYFRSFSFFVALLVLLMGLFALNRIVAERRIHQPLLFATAAVLSVLLFLPTLLGAIPTERGLQFTVFVLLMLYTAALFYESKKGNGIGLASVLLLTCFELYHASYITTDTRPAVTANEHQQRIGYNDYTKEAIQYLKSIDKGFYRVYKDYSSGPAMHASLNDAKVFGFYGAHSYHSFNQRGYIAFLSGTKMVDGRKENQTRWAVFQDHLVPMNLASLKYRLTTSDEVAARKDFYEQIAQFGNVKVLKHRYNLPLGVAFDGYMTVGDFNSLPPQTRDFALATAVLLPEEDAEGMTGLHRITPSQLPQSYTFDQYQHLISNLRAQSLQISHHSQNSIEGTISLDQPGMLFLAIPFDKGWSATVDGKQVPLEEVDFGLMGIMLSPGEHSIALSYSPPLAASGLVVTLIALGLYLYLLFRWRRGDFEATAYSPKGEDALAPH